ncbi:Tigger transposable element-derived protein 2, partial [Stegodyphus mimosarum]
MGSSDLIAQTAIEKCELKEIEMSRVARFAFLGACFVGPVLRVWYNILEKGIGTIGRTAGLKKMLIDQVWMNSYTFGIGFFILCTQITLCEKASADTEAAEEFADEFIELITSEQLSPEQIYDADETSLFWQYVLRNTLATSTERAPTGVKDSKARLTILACADAAGTHKCKLFVIGKHARPRAFKGLLDYVKKCGEAVIKEDDITEVFHCDNAPIISQLTDGEICSMVLDPENTASNSEENDREVIENERISNDNLVGILDTAITGLEQWNFVTEQEIMSVYRIKEKSVFSPCFIGGFLTVSGLLQLQPWHKIGEKIKKLWPAAQLITFYVIPLELRHLKNAQVLTFIICTQGDSTAPFTAMAYDGTECIQGYDNRRSMCKAPLILKAAHWIQYIQPD